MSTDDESYLPALFTSTLYHVCLFSIHVYVRILAISVPCRPIPMSRGLILLRFRRYMNLLLTYLLYRQFSKAHRPAALDALETSA